MDYYLEDLTESGQNTNLIKNKRDIHANVCFQVRKTELNYFMNTEWRKFIVPKRF